MKSLFTLIALCALIVTASAQQARYEAQTVSAGPATLATTVTTNLASPPTIDVRKQKEVAFQVRFNQSGASTSNVVYTLQTSVDGTYWDSTRTIVLTFPSTGTTDVVGVTNVTVNGLGYLRLYSIANATALTTMTNKQFSYAVKIP